jgi:hypothetical protein
MGEFWALVPSATIRRGVARSARVGRDLRVRVAWCGERHHRVLPFDPAVHHPYRTEGPAVLFLGSVRLAIEGSGGARRRLIENASKYSTLC